MNNLIIERFLKNPDPSDPATRRRAGALSSITGACCNLVLFAAKLVIGMISGSIAITADAFNNLSDLGSCFIALLGMRLATKPADKDHPFGHGRYEYITTMAVAVVILIVAFELAKSSFERILDPSDVALSLPLILVLVLSMLVKLWMCFFNRALGKKIDSGVMQAAALDSISDVIATGSVLVATVAGELFSVRIDGWMGLLVAVFIFYSGIGVIKENLGYILGEAPPEELTQAIVSSVLEYDGVEGIHDLIVHSYGPTMYMATIHVEVSASQDISISHDLIDLIEREVSAKLAIKLTIHMDPIVVDSELVRQTRAKAAEVVASIDSRLSIHDFRMVDGPTHTNLIFDVVLPYELKMTEQQVEQAVSEAISECNPSWFAVTTIDRSYL